MEENNLNEGEIPPKQIFELMKKNIYDNFINYSYSAINKDYISSRKSLFNILHKITIKMGFKSQTFFLCAHYLDIIFTKKRRVTSNLNTLGLACLCLSAKFCENDPIVPHLQYFIRIFNYIMGYKNIITMSELKRTEVLVLKILNYKLNYYTIYDFNSFLFGHGILKIEQLKDIDNKNKKTYRSKRKEFSINPSNSLLIKIILEKIYKKSRYYLDDVINNTNLCFKYNPLYLSIYIMKKSVEDILSNEQKVNDLTQKEQEDFYSKTNSCFKQIMFEFYKIDYETNEQYREILADDEIIEIFEGKEKNVDDPAPSADRKIQKQDEKNVKNVKNNNVDLDLELDLDSNLNINNEIDNKSNFSSTYSNGFYNKNKIKSNNNINKKQNEKNILSSRKENTNININNNNYNTNYDYNNKDDINDEDDLDTNLNINELQNVKWNNNRNNNNKYNNTKSTYSIYSNSKKQNKNEQSLSNNNNYLIQNKYLIATNNRYTQRGGDTFKNTNTIKKSYLNNNNYDLTYSVNANRGNKISLNKNVVDLKTEKTSPIKYDGTSIRNKYLQFKKLNQYLKLKGMTGNERSDYSHLLKDNANTNTHINSNININNINTNTNINPNININPNNFNYNTIKKYEKKPYFRKLIYTNNDNINSNTLNSINRNGISSYYYSNSNINKNNEKNDTNTLNRNKIDINNKELITSKINTFYSRVRIKNRNNDNISNKTSDNSEDINDRNNNLNYKKNEITTTSSRFRRRFYHHNNNTNNNNNNNNIINNNNDLSTEIKNTNTIIIKDNNKKEIESYNQSNSNSNSTTINSSIFKKIQTSNIFRRKNKLLNINTNNDNSESSNDISDDNKGMTSRNFNKNNNNIANKISVNTTRTTDIRNTEINKSYEPSKRISYVLVKKNSDLNNTLKEINKARAKNEEININTNNDGSKKVYQSIRHKYLNLKKNLNNNSNNNINNTTNNINKNKTISDLSKLENHSTTNINMSSNLNMSKFTLRNKIINTNNKVEDNNINNNSINNPISTRISDIDNKNKNKNVAESSLYRFINKTKTLFSRNSKEEEPNTKRIIDKNNNVNNDKNNNSYNFFKSQQNFYKPTNKNGVADPKLNAQKEDSQQNSKLNNTAYLRSIINKNKLTKENKENPNSKSQKNTSTIVINNNININIGNKTNNINNEYVNYKNIYKKNNTPDINNDILKTNNSNNTNNNIITNRSVKTNNINNDNNNTGNTFTNLLHRFHFYKKSTEKNNNNNNDNNNSNINNSNINNKNEKFQFFHKK